MCFVYEKFKELKNFNNKEWKLIDYLFINGYNFRNPYCGFKRYNYFAFPEHLDEVKTFIRKMRNLGAKSSVLYCLRIT